MTVPMNALAQSELCRGLSESEIRTVHALAEEHPLAAGTALFAEGDAGDAVYLVLEGEVAIEKRDGAGQARALATLGVGALLGEMTLVQPGTTRSASARATGSTRLLRISSPRFQGLLQQDAVAALKVVRNVARVLAQRLAALDGRVVGLLAQSEGARHQELQTFQKLLTEWDF